MDVILMPMVSVLLITLNLYWWAVVIYMLLEWLEHFNVINRYNQFVYNLHNFLFKIVEPALDMIRRFLPRLGNIDLSPLILMLLIVFFEGVIAN